MKTCFCRLAEKIKQNENSPLYLIYMIVFLVGVIAGFLISPVKQGISVGSHNRIETCKSDNDKE